MTTWLDRLLAAAGPRHMTAAARRLAAPGSPGTRLAGRGTSAAYLAQSWRDVTFVHWPYDRRALEPALPPGLEIEEHEGTAWLTLAALRTTGARLRWTPAMPLLSSFGQTNLRTYVRGPRDVPGIWLLSVDAGQVLATLGARVLGAPYHLAREAITCERGEAGTEVVRYVGVRQSRAAPAGCKLVIRPGEPVAGSERDRWLTDRRHAYTARRGVLLRHQVSHEPWALRAASLVSLTQTLTTAAGLPLPSGDPVVRYSDGVAGVRMGLPRPV